MPVSGGPIDLEDRLENHPAPPVSGVLLHTKAPHDTPQFPLRVRRIVVQPYCFDPQVDRFVKKFRAARFRLKDWGNEGLMEW